MVQFSLRGVSDKDALTLTPLELLWKYRVLPLEAFFHFVGFIFIVVLVFMVNSQLSTYYRFNEKSFEELFLSPSAGEEIVRLDTLLSRLNTTVYNYFNVNDITVQNFRYLESPAPPINLTVNRKTGSPIMYQLTLNNSLGPLQHLNATQISSYLDTVVNLEERFTLISVDRDDPDGNPEKTWDVTVTFDYSDGIMREHLSISQRRRVRSSNVAGLAIAIVVVIMSLVSFGFSLYKVVLGISIRQRSKQRFDSIPAHRLRERFRAMNISPPPVVWSSLPFRIRTDFFMPWSLYSLSGDVCIIASCLLSVIPYSSVPSHDFERLIFGVGVLIATSRLTAYLEIFPGLYTLIYTLKLCAVKILKYILSVMPLFVGFMFCADILFGPHSENFLSSGVTAVTLFALINGDDIHGIFQDLDARYPYGPWVSRIYLYFFTLFWINAILNVFIFIIEDSFHLAKLLSAKYRMSDEELPGTYQVRYQAEFAALQRGLDMEKFFNVIDKEAPVVWEDQRLALLHDSEGEGVPVKSGAHLAQSAMAINDALHNYDHGGSAPMSEEDEHRFPMHATKPSSSSSKSGDLLEISSSTSGPLPLGDSTLDIVERHQTRFLQRIDDLKRDFLQDLRADLARHSSSHH